MVRTLSPISKSCIFLGPLLCTGTAATAEKHTGELGVGVGADVTVGSEGADGAVGVAAGAALFSLFIVGNRKAENCACILAVCFLFNRNMSADRNFNRLAQKLRKVLKRNPVEVR